MLPLRIGRFDTIHHFRKIRGGGFTLPEGMLSCAQMVNYSNLLKVVPNNPLHPFKKEGSKRIWLNRPV